MQTVRGPVANLPPILVLAAGRSSRMGGVDKLERPAFGQPLLRRTVQSALETGAEVYVTLPARTHPRARLLDGLDVSIVPVPDADEGQAISLRRGVAALPVCAQFMVLLADMPLITSGDMTALMKFATTYPDALVWRATTQLGAAGHPIVFSACLRPQFETLKGDIGAAGIIRANPDAVRLFPLPDERALYDLDTEEAWAEFKKTYDI